MHWLKTIGYGIVLFAVMFVIGSIAMFALKLSGPLFSLIMLVASIIVIWLLAQQYKITSLTDGLTVGLIWLAVDALLEYYVIVMTFNKGNPSLYTSSVLLGYLLIVLIPTYVGSTSKK